MAEVIWSPASLDDIDAIAHYIARDSQNRASLFVERLIQAAEKLKLLPLLGRVIPEIGRDDCREVIYGSYRIMYKIVDGDIWITGIVHGAKNWKPDWI
ncbi:MAG: type II toxin-antitoxin system RelE/ParE family toxin [Fibrobacteres bacterium]|nr:type II toxin-antitoxin system RelE/ParE family toxin [Fibrobacterota bacterium]